VSITLRKVKKFSQYVEDDESGLDFLRNFLCKLKREVHDEELMQEQ